MVLGFIGTTNMVNYSDLFVTRYFGADSFNPSGSFSTAIPQERIETAGPVRRNLGFKEGEGEVFLLASVIPRLSELPVSYGISPVSAGVEIFPADSKDSGRFNRQWDYIQNLRAFFDTIRGKESSNYGSLRATSRFAIGTTGSNSDRQKPLAFLYTFFGLNSGYPDNDMHYLSDLAGKLMDDQLDANILPFGFSASYPFLGYEEGEGNKFRGNISDNPLLSNFMSRKYDEHLKRQAAV